MIYSMIKYFRYEKCQRTTSGIKITDEHTKIISSDVTRVCKLLSKVTKQLDEI